MLNGNQHKSNHLACNHPRKEAGPIRRPKIKHSSPAHCAHVKRPTRVQLPALQPTNARFTPGRGSAFLKNSGDRYKRHAARIDIVSVTNKVTFTRTSADTRVGAIEHPQIPYPRILMDWAANPLRETQPRPRPLQRKIPTEVNSLHRAYAVGNRRCGAHTRCSRRNNPCQDASIHGKSGSAGAPNVLCPQPEASPTHFFVKLTMLYR